MTPSGYILDCSAVSLTTLPPLSVPVNYSGINEESRDKNRLSIFFCANFTWAVDHLFCLLNTVHAYTEKHLSVDCNTIITQNIHHHVVLSWFIRKMV